MNSEEEKVISRSNEFIKFEDEENDFEPELVLNNDLLKRNGSAEMSVPEKHFEQPVPEKYIERADPEKYSEPRIENKLEGILDITLEKIFLKEGVNPCKENSNIRPAPNDYLTFMNGLKKLISNYLSHRLLIDLAELKEKIKEEKIELEKKNLEEKEKTNEYYKQFANESIEKIFACTEQYLEKEETMDFKFDNNRIEAIFSLPDNPMEIMVCYHNGILQLHSIKEKKMLSSLIINKDSYCTGNIFLHEFFVFCHLNKVFGVNINSMRNNLGESPLELYRLPDRFSKQFPFKNIQIDQFGQLIININDGMLYIYTIFGNREQDYQELNFGKSDIIKSVCTYKSNKMDMIAVSHKENKIIIHDCLEKQSREFQTKSLINAMIFHPKGLYLFCGSEDSMLIFINTKSMEKLGPIGGHELGIISVSISPDKRFILTGGRDGYVILYDLDQLSIIAKHKVQNSLSSTSFNSDTSLILSFSKDESNLCLHRLPYKINNVSHSWHKGAVTAIDVWDDILLTGGIDCTVKFVDMKTGFEMGQFKSHQKQVIAVNFYSSGRRALSLGEDTFLILYNVVDLTISRQFENCKIAVAGSFSSSFNALLAWEEMKGINFYYEDNFGLKPLRLEKEETENSSVNDLEVFWIKIFESKEDKGKLSVIVALSQNLGEYQTWHASIIKIYSYYENDPKIKLEENIDFSTNKLLHYITHLRLMGDNKTLAIYIASKGGILFEQIGSLKHSNCSNFVCLEKVLPPELKNEVFSFTFPSEGFNTSSGSRINFMAYNISQEIGLFLSLDRCIIIDSEKFEPKLDINSFAYDQNLKVWKLIETNEENVKSPTVLYGTDQGRIKHITLNKTGKSRQFPELAEGIRVMAVCSDRRNGGILAYYSGKEIRILDISQRIVQNIIPFTEKDFEISHLRFLSDSHYLIAVGDNYTCLLFIDLRNPNIMYRSEGKKDEVKISAFEAMSNIKTSPEVIMFFGTEKGEILGFKIDNIDNIDKVKCFYPMNKNQGNKIIKAETQNSNQIQPNPIISLKPFTIESSIEPRLIGVYTCSRGGAVEKLTFQKYDDNIQYYERKVLFENKVNICCVKFSDDTNKIIIGDESRFLHVIEFSTLSVSLYGPFSHPICIVDFLYDSKYVLAAFKDNTFCIIIDNEGYKIVHDFQLDDEIFSICVVPCYDTIILGTSSGLDIKERVINNDDRMLNFSKLLNGQFSELKKNKSKIIGLSKIEEIIELFFKKQEFKALMPYPLSLSILSLVTILAVKEKSLLYSVISQTFILTMETVNKQWIVDIIFSPDFITNKSPWGWWMLALFDEKDMNLKKIISSNLLQIMYLSKPLKNRIENKTEFILLASKLLPEHVLSLLNFCWVNVDASLLNRQPHLSDSIMDFPHTIVGDYPNPPVNYIILKLQNRLGKNNMIGNIGTTRELRLYYCQITPGDFLEFIKIFSEYSSNSRIYSQQLVDFLLDFIWENFAKKHFFINLLIYSIFLVLVCVNLLWIFPNRMNNAEKHSQINDLQITTVSIVMNSISLFYIVFVLLPIEVLSIIKSTQTGLLAKLATYFSSVWNIIDFFLITSGVISLSLDYVQIFSFDPQLTVYGKVLFSGFLCLVWLRLMEFARGFPATSVLIRLLNRVFSDMFGFLIILFLTVIGFALPTYLLQTNYEGTTPWNFMKIFYGVLLGDFGDFMGLSSSLNSDLYFMIFLIITVFLVIVMLNLLIAIISDSFEKVMAIDEQGKAYEKLQLIYDILRTVKNSNIQSFCKGEGSRFLYLIEKVNEDATESVEERIRIKIDRQEVALRRQEDALRRQEESLMRLGKDLDDKFRMIIPEINAINARLNPIMEKINSLEKDFKANHEVKPNNLTEDQILGVHEHLDVSYADIQGRISVFEKNMDRRMHDMFSYFHKIIENQREKEVPNYPKFQGNRGDLPRGDNQEVEMNKPENSTESALWEEV